jgi:hypothetical protein
MISDREHALEVPKADQFAPPDPLPLRSLKQRALPAQTQPRPATVAVRLMSLGVAPNSLEGTPPLAYKDERKPGADAFATVWPARADIPFGELLGPRTRHRRCVAEPIDAPGNTRTMSSQAATIH